MAGILGHCLKLAALGSAGITLYNVIIEAGGGKAIKEQE